MWTCVIPLMTTTMAATIYIYFFFTEMRKKLSVIFCIREIVYASMVNTELCIAREIVYMVCVCGQAKDDRKYVECISSMNNIHAERRKTHSHSGSGSNRTRGHIHTDMQYADKQCMNTLKRIYAINTPTCKCVWWWWVFFFLLLFVFLLK